MEQENAPHTITEPPIALSGLNDVVMQLYGEDELREWLISQGFRCAPDSLKYRENECNWYAYRRSEFQARNCEFNSEKAGMQIIVKPSVMQIGDHKHRSAEIELTGEVNGVLWNLSAYSLKPEDVPVRLAGVEIALVAAWNALLPNAALTGAEPQAKRPG